MKKFLLQTTLICTNIVSQNPLLASDDTNNKSNTITTSQINTTSINTNETTGNSIHTNEEQNDTNSKSNNVADPTAEEIEAGFQLLNAKEFKERLPYYLYNVKKTPAHRGSSYSYEDRLVCLNTAYKNYLDQKYSLAWNKFFEKCKFLEELGVSSLELLNAYNLAFLLDGLEKVHKGIFVKDTLARLDMIVDAFSYGKHQVHDYCKYHEELYKQCSNGQSTKVKEIRKEIERKTEIPTGNIKILTSVISERDLAENWLQMVVLIRCFNGIPPYKYFVGVKKTEEEKKIISPSANKGSKNCNLNDLEISKQKSVKTIETSINYEFLPLSSLCNIMERLRTKFKLITSISSDLKMHAVDSFLNYLIVAERDFYLNLKNDIFIGNDTINKGEFLLRFSLLSPENVQFLKVWKLTDDNILSQEGRYHIDVMAKLTEIFEFAKNNFGEYYVLSKDFITTTIQLLKKTDYNCEDAKAILSKVFNQNLDNNQKTANVQKVKQLLESFFDEQDPNDAEILVNAPNQIVIRFQKLSNIIRNFNKEFYALQEEFNKIAYDIKNLISNNWAYYFNKQTCSGTISFIHSILEKLGNNVPGAKNKVPGSKGAVENLRSQLNDISKIFLNLFNEPERLKPSEGHSVVKVPYIVMSNKIKALLASIEKDKVLLSQYKIDTGKVSRNFSKIIGTIECVEKLAQQLDKIREKFDDLSKKIDDCEFLITGKKHGKTLSELWAEIISQTKNLLKDLTAKEYGSGKTIDETSNYLQKIQNLKFDQKVISSKERFNIIRQKQDKLSKLVKDGYLKNAKILVNSNYEIVLVKSDLSDKIKNYEYSKDEKSPEKVVEACVVDFTRELFKLANIDFPTIATIKDCITTGNQMDVLKKTIEKIVEHGWSPNRFMNALRILYFLEGANINFSVQLKIGSSVKEQIRKSLITDEFRKKIRLEVEEDPNYKQLEKASEEKNDELKNRKKFKKKPDNITKEVNNRVNLIIEDEFRKRCKNEKLFENSEYYKNIVEQTLSSLNEYYNAKNDGSNSIRLRLLSLLYQDNLLRFSDDGKKLFGLSSVKMTKISEDMEQSLGNCTIGISEKQIVEFADTLISKQLFKSAIQKNIVADIIARLRNVYKSINEEVPDKQNINIEIPDFVNLCKSVIDSATELGLSVKWKSWQGFANLVQESFIKAIEINKNNSDADKAEIIKNAKSKLSDALTKYKKDILEKYKNKELYIDESTGYLSK